MSSTDKPVTRARATRAEEEAPRRRRRDPNDHGQTRRLALPEEKLDRANFAYRFVNDVDDRIPNLYAQDWDLVPQEELGADYSVERNSSALAHVAVKMRLMKKPIDFYNEDHAAKQKALTDEMKAAELGQKVLNGPGTESGLSESVSYKPNNVNKL